MMGVSDKEICLKIFSPYVPNINLIDLPGLAGSFNSIKGNQVISKYK